MIDLTKKNIVHYADILAIPFFFITFYYFYAKPNRTLFEILIMIFVFIGFICDSFFTYNFLTGKYK